MSKFDWNVNDIKLSGNFLLIPTVDVVVFPKMVVPLLVVDKNVIAALNSQAQKVENVILVASQNLSRENSENKITKHDLFKVGTISKIIRNINLIDSTAKIVVQGCGRVNIDSIDDNGTSFTASCSNFDFIYDDENNNIGMVENFVKELISMLEQNDGQSSCFGADFQFIISQIQDPERLVDFIITNISLDIASAQELLEKNKLSDLLSETKKHFKAYLERNAVKEDVKISARNSINQSQREYFLREQLRAIKKELGDQEESELDELKRKIEESQMSKEAREECQRQMRRLERMSPDSLEAVVIRNHLEWILAMPWNHFIHNPTIDIKKAKDVLDKDHFGLSAIKEKILDYLSVKAFKSKYNSQILCLAGPPGVGKTSIGQSIAKALGRTFARISLGGVHDESEIRGHRRTYVGALPGRIIQSIRKAGSCNPVIIFDELDKICTSSKGDPAAALLEVLDPEQNCNFYDNYLGVSFDISNTMFIATCNDLSSIPGPLRDRMEVISLSGYTANEKMIIAKTHLIPKLIKNMGLEDKGFEINDETLTNLVLSYTRENGVRELERILAKLCSKFARSLVENGNSLSFSTANLSSFLGLGRNRSEEYRFANKVGVTNGLAWTARGGELLQVEAMLIPGNGKMILTGQLGDVMKESAQAAISYARAKAKDYNIDEKMFSNYDMHIHLPAGAIQKDGPSAGVTLLSSILSALTNRAIDAKCAMTGELNLQGQVLPIGGLREKILAAQQYGLTKVFIPESNRRDFEEERNSIDTSGLEVFFIKDVEEILQHVLL